MIPGSPGGFILVLFVLLSLVAADDSSWRAPQRASLSLSRSGFVSACMSPPPSLLRLTLATAVLHIHRLSDLSSVPDHLVFHLFQNTLAAGKLTDHVLRMFLATGNEDVQQLVKALRIRPVIQPILPTRCSDKEF